MPKQGKVAKASRQVRIKNGGGKVKRQGRLIDPDQLENFLLVRYALTARRHINPSERESCQRFLQEVASRLNGGNVVMDQFSARLVGDLLPQLSWQFFMQVANNWPTLRQFLGRELPAVPLRDRLRVASLPTEAEFNELLVTKLARQIAALTLLNKANSADQREMLATAMQQTLYQNGQISWAQVRVLYAPLGYTVPENVDDGTRQWLLDLVKV